jgi:spore germination protein PD
LNYTVVNKELSVGGIRIIGVSASSVVLIGDAETMSFSSVFDTPPESLIVGRQLIPLAPGSG